jgi:hypothetical protein
MTNVYLPANTDAVETAKARATRLAVRGVIGAGLAAALAVGMAGTAFAQPPETDGNSGGSTQGKVQVESSILLTALTPSFLLTGIPGATVGPAVVTYNVETNNTAGYSVTVQSQVAAMVPASGTNADRIPIGALSVKETVGGTYSPVTAATQVVHTQAVRSAAGGDALSTSFQVVIPFVKSDIYSATLDYVATTL